MKFSSTLRWAAGVAVAAGIVLVAIPAMGSEPGNPGSVTFTGCVRTSGDNAGTLAALKEGSSPRRACLASEKQIKVSGGDITSVGAGTGLDVQAADKDQLGILGATSGAAHVSIEPGYQLPQGCTTGQVPRRKTTGTGFECSAPGGRIVVGEASGGQPVADNAFATIRTLDLPAGKWAVTAKLVILPGAGNPGGLNARCQLVGSGDTYLDDDAVAGPSWDGVTLLGTVQSANNTSVRVECKDVSGSQTDWWTLRILAVEGSNVQKVNLN